jgi:hypothetical protein
MNVKEEDRERRPAALPNALKTHARSRPHSTRNAGICQAGWLPLSHFRAAVVSGSNRDSVVHGAAYRGTRLPRKLPETAQYSEQIPEHAAGIRTTSQYPEQRRKYPGHVAVPGTRRSTRDTSQVPGTTSQVPEQRRSTRNNAASTGHVAGTRNNVAGTRKRRKYRNVAGTLRTPRASCGLLRMHLQVAPSMTFPPAPWRAVVSLLGLTLVAPAAELAGGAGKTGELKPARVCRIQRRSQPAMNR